MQILSCIDRMDKAVPGVRAGYDSLSEIAHPNWSGDVCPTWNGQLVARLKEDHRWRISRTAM
ncbi:hypothetical protein X739_29770 [Mesorhizobium sp. LNHC220B00]|nr:hypothetical protein [Mesorhizobium sp. LNHC220B00]ESY79954.1 hypothetical protein X739_29770 [Mesorhizobium sp. LNHC220B00]